MSVPLLICLSAQDEARLSVVVQRGKANVRTLKRAQVLRKLHAQWTPAEIADACDVSLSTVSNIRRRYLTGGLDAVLTDRQQERRRQALTGEQQAHLIAVACTDAPEGHDHWTLRLLAGKVVELGYVEHIAVETIRSVLKKTISSPGSTRSGVCRP